MFRQHPRRAFFEKIENLAGNRQKLSLVRITTSYLNEFFDFFLPYQNVLLCRHFLPRTARCRKPLQRPPLTIKKNRLIGNGPFYNRVLWQLAQFKTTLVSVDLRTTSFFKKSKKSKKIKNFRTVVSSSKIPLSHLLFGQFYWTSLHGLCCCFKRPLNV